MIFKQIKKLIMTVGVVCIIGGIGYLFLLTQTSQETITDTAFLMSSLEEASELTTAKLNYKGYSIYTEDTGIDFISKSGFLMTYDAIVRAGIDIKEVEISADDELKIITITIPKAIIQSIDIVESSIELFNKNLVIFDFDQHEDLTEAISKAEKDAEDKIESMGILEMANDHAEVLIRDLITPLIPSEYTIEILMD